MNDSARRRGPDAADHLIHGRVGLGHTRLAIVDLNSRSNQPFSIGKHHLAFNGEIYNFRELRELLRRNGTQFETGSDTEVLLQCLINWGMDCLKLLDGMFAFVYYDEDAGVVYVARDRFGKKPLHYSHTEDVFLVSSECKQILAALPSRPSANLPIVADFIAVGGADRGTSTFFREICELPAGCYGEFSLTINQIRTTRWYNLGDQIRRSEHTYEEAVLNVRSLLLAAVGKRQVADVKVGACLSGGLDSSAIVSLMAGQLGQADLTAITAYVPLLGFDERSFSDAIVEKFGVRNELVAPDPTQIWDLTTIEELAWVQEEPIVGASCFNQYCVFRRARDLGLKVMLDGQGADEYFGGYGQFWFAKQMELLKAGHLGDFVDGLRERSKSLGSPLRVIATNFGRTLLRRGGAGNSTEYLGAKLMNLRQGGATGDLRTMSFEQLSIWSMNISPLPNLLATADKSSMYWSVESRMPFLDHKLVEYVLGLPTSYKIAGGLHKRILRDAVPELPPEVRRRRDKIAFASPDAVMLFESGPAVRVVLEGALDRLGPMIDRERTLLRFDQCSDRRSYDYLFFKILSLDAWFRRFNCAS